jgi:hypothetical protein
MGMKKATTMGRASMRKIITMNIPVLIRISGCHRRW